MRKHTLLENVISGFIGAALAIPIGLYAINHPTQAKTVNYNIRHEIITIEETTPPSEDKPKTSEKKTSEKKQSKKTSDKKSLGTFKVTAYCSCSECCGKSDGITASGTKVKQGRTIAVDPKVIPLGSKVKLNDHTYIAEDVGGAIKGNCIDLYFDSHAEAQDWGVKYKEVKLLEEAD